MSDSLFTVDQNADSAANSRTSPARTDRGLPGISLTGSFRFRAGQYTFLRKLASALDTGASHHLGVFVPGYGKTITALSSYVIARALGVAQRLVIFVPRGNLRDQYADRDELAALFTNIGAGSVSFSVADSEQVFLKNLETEIIVTTYQYASGEGGAAALRTFCERAPTMFVFDEVHHLSEDGMWASVISTFDCACSVSLSGTPIRSDNKPLFGVPTEEGPKGESFYHALHEVGMRDAHAEGKILKAVEAHVVDYHLTMVREDTGERVELTLSDLAEQARDSNDVDAYLARRKLRFHDVYLETLLDPAFARFLEKRERLASVSDDRKATAGRAHQMLVIAMSNRHAAAMLAFINRRYPGFTAARIGQDVPARDRKKRLLDYREGRIDVMVQVDMIGEGTDIKPISVIVKADLVRAWSKTMQQIFRGMRYCGDFPKAENVCDVYSADDSQVVATLSWVTSEFRAGIKMRDEFEDRPERSANGAPTPSLWNLTGVAHHDSQTHVLELFPGEGAAGGGEIPELKRAEVLDVSAREEELRRDCAALANQLSFLLEGRGIPADPRRIHHEAMRKFAKAQGRLSLVELEKKKTWLTRCIAKRNLD